MLNPLLGVSFCFLTAFAWVSVGWMTWKAWKWADLVEWEKAMVRQLQDEFRERVPNGWVFFDGKGC